MIETFKEKANKLYDRVTTDPRWDINDQTLFDVFGLTYYGYCFGVGRLICFLESEEINSFVLEKLVKLGAGEKYVSGLIDFAYSTFVQPTEGINAQLVEIGHSHFFYIRHERIDGLYIYQCEKYSTIKLKKLLTNPCKDFPFYES